MAITTATELKAALASWSKRDDLADLMDDFIELAEAGIARSLRVRGMEATFGPVALVDGAAALPAGFLGFKELRSDGAVGATLEPRPLEWLRNQPPLAGEPRYFAVGGADVLCWPSAGTVTGTYYEAPASLTTNATNWLLTQAPDLYLFACLTEIAVYALDEERAVLWRQRTRALLDELQAADNATQINGGPLTAKAR